ncbi:MAG: transcription termination/antitermination NusG family protein, partial [Pseudonocardiaceae bacterium]
MPDTRAPVDDQQGMTHAKKARPTVTFSGGTFSGGTSAGGTSTEGTSTEETSTEDGQELTGLFRAETADAEAAEVDTPEVDTPEDAAEVESLDVVEPVDDADQHAAAAEVEAPEPVDPVDELRSALATAPGEWYVVHSYAGYENKVKANLETRIQTLDVEDYIFQVEVPTEEVTEIKNGQRKQVNRKVLPGYILVRMDLTDESWAAVRNTPGVTGFVGATSRPSPLSLDDVVKFLLPQGAAKKAAKGAASTAAAASEGGFERPVI